MKYIFQNASGYYKFCRKIPNSNIQFIFSLRTKNKKIAKNITRAFLLKSGHYYDYLQNLSKDEIMIRFEEIQEVLDEYKIEALAEYSLLEKSRHAHFTFNKKDGAHPDSIDHWLKEMQDHICGNKTERETQELARKILTRSSMPLKTFFKTITNEEKEVFFQLLIKTESSILKKDYQRALEYFDKDYEAKSNVSPQGSNIAQDVETILHKVLDARLGSTSIVQIGKYDAMEHFLGSDDVIHRYQKEKHLYNVPLQTLMQVSDKEYLEDYTLDDYLKFFEAFIWTPSGITKIDSVIEMHNGNFIDIAEAFRNEELDDEEMEVQSETTLQNKMVIINNFIRHCITHQFLSKNLIEQNKKKFGKEKIRVVAKSIKKRQPFESEELSKMFRLFIENNFFLHENIAYFYIPMIAMFSGMRMEEICKLRKQDINKTEGIYYFDINGYVKTTDSIRKVPIHPYLIQGLKFLKYVESRDDMLFDLQKITLHGKPKYSRKYIPVFSEFRDQFVTPERVENDMVTFHAFRHYFSTKLYAGGVKMDEISALLGHKITNNETPTYILKDIERLYSNILKLNNKHIAKDLKLLSVSFLKTQK